MAGQFSKVDQRRITFLSLLSSAATAGATPGTIDQDAVYHTAQDWLERMEEDGFFEEAAPQRSSRPTPAPRGRSDRPASRGQSSRSGSGEFKGFRNPDAPATERQIAAAIKLGADYSEDELADFSMQEISDLMNDLKS
jgi:hypothetical protein